MSTARLVCLANSWKESGRCVAGIELATGKWVRPVSNLLNGVVPQPQTIIAGKELALLDVFDVPLDTSGPDFGFERENRLIQEGPWCVVGRITPSEAMRYCENGILFLHNCCKYVGKDFIAGLPVQERRTLQLVSASDLEFKKTLRAGGNSKWDASIAMSNGQLRWLGLTDPVFCKKLDAGYRPSGPYLLTLSLSLPYTPPGWNEPKNPCWKLVAGVVEV